MSKKKGDFQPAYYKDQGCSLAPSCLNCPLPRCRYDAPQAAAGIARWHRFDVVAAFEGGETLESLAERFGVRTIDVWRVVAA